MAKGECRDWKVGGNRGSGSLDADDFAVGVVREEGGLCRDQVAVQEEGDVRGVSAEDLGDPVEDNWHWREALEAARYGLVLVSEKDGGVEGSREGGVE